MAIISNELIDIIELKECININNFLSNIPYKCTNLLCMHINIRSLIKNFAALEQCIYSCDRCIDIIILTEANIKDNVSSLFKIEGYGMHTELRKNRTGGGIIIYYNKKHKLTIINTTTKNFECMLFEITTPNTYSLTVCAIYRPPKNSKHLFLAELKSILNKINPQSDVCFTGDINIDLKTESPIKHRYNNILYGCGVACGITEYTRIELRKNKHNKYILTKSCIDHIYARSRTQDLFTAAIGTKLADHRAVVLALCGTNTNHIQHVPLKKTKYNYEKLKTLMDQIDWHEVNTMSCPQKIYEFITQNFNRCYEESKMELNIKSNPLRSSNYWVNDKIIKACEYRDNLFMQWISDTNNMILKQKYNKARNFANKIIENTKNTNLKNQIHSNKNNHKILWNILNKLTGRIKPSIDSIIINAFKKQSITLQEIANKFSTTFINNVKNIIPTCNNLILNRNLYKKSVNVSIRFKKATIYNVKPIIDRLNIRKAPGLDRIRAIDVKLICNKMTLAISKLINASIERGQYPAELKTGIVRPIHKTGAKKDYDNYRPITILPTLDKIIEKFISNQIHKFYNDNQILSNKQYGFQRGKSTTQLLSSFTDVIYKHLDSRKQILVVFVDYSKAFDTLKHNILLEALDDSGIRGPLFDWCKDYLYDRSFYTKIGESFSDRVSVTDGTAQGSVLGPLHYLTYVNALPNLISKCEIFQFADDTCLLAADVDVKIALKRLQNDFNLLNMWSHDCGLVLNAKKTKLLYISSSQNRLQTDLKLIAHSHCCMHTDRRIACNCPPLEVVEKQTYLGLVIDDRMKWTSHIHGVCDKLRAILAKFSIIRNKIPFQIRLSLYKALGESIIGYGLSSYGRTFKSHLDLIYDLQLRILKKIVPHKIKQKYMDDFTKLFTFCEILPIHEKVKYALLVEQFFNKDLQLQQIRKNPARTNTQPKLILPRCQNQYGCNQLNYKIPYLINELPTNLKQEINHQNIKTKIKEYYLEKVS